MTLLLLWFLFFLVAATASASAKKFTCSAAEKLSHTYLDQIVKNSVGKGFDQFVTNFVPTAYYHGTTVKYVSTDAKTLDNEQVCVDGNTVSSVIQLYDDGTHGDDVAGDGVYSRSCIHFCEKYVDFIDYWGFAFERYIERTHLIVLRPGLKGKIPLKTLPNPLHPHATLLATSHAAFFIDHKAVYYPKWPLSAGAVWDSPTGKNHAFSALLKVFGDVFDFLTISSFDNTRGLPGASTWRWNKWDRQGGDAYEQRIGDIDRCVIGLSGVPITRLMAGITNIDTVQWFDAQTHELAHGVAGFRYHNALEKARNVTGGHVPSSCTTDHSSLQGPMWDWVKGYPTDLEMGYCHGSDDAGCQTISYDVVRLVANDDCNSCPDQKLSQCCSFSYVDALATKVDMKNKPELYTMSPLLMYIAGLLPKEQVPANQKAYYCIGPDLEQGCGVSQDNPDRKPCDDIPVYDNDRSKVKSSYVRRFTFDELVAANGGPRNPPVRAERDLRHGAIYVAQRFPSDAEIVFYTMMWRHHEIQRYPYGRVPRPGRDREDVLLTWLYTTNGRSTLHSRYHGIPCGGGLQVPSCTNDETACDNAACHPLAICIPFDGRPFCVCPDGLVGDGTTCAMSNETISYPLQSAHELYNDSGARNDCFGTDWPNRIKQIHLPPYPGGIAPYAATSCEKKVCPVANSKCVNGVCRSLPNLNKLVKVCIPLIFQQAKCQCWKDKGCITNTINNTCMKDLDTEKYGKQFLFKMGNAVNRFCERKKLVNACVSYIFEQAQCSCQENGRLCIKNTLEETCIKELDTSKFNIWVFRKEANQAITLACEISSAPAPTQAPTLAPTQAPAPTNETKVQAEQ